MLRIMYTYIVPFLLPASIYIAWVSYRTRYVAKHGGEAPQLEQGPWPLLLVLGAILTFAALVVTAFSQGGSPDSTYVPPHLEGGQVVPGHLEPKDHLEPKKP